jgi:hypothetical protein
MTYQGRNCPDCGVTVVADTGPVENYMLRDHVWKAAGMGYADGFLCVECLESRLGRPLTAADLDPDMPINYPGMQRDTPRLFQLKSEAWGWAVS